MGAEAVEQRGMQRIGSLNAPKDTCCPRAEVSAQCTQGRVERRMPAASQRAADKVENGSPGFLANVVRDVLKLMLYHPGRQGFGFRHDSLLCPFAGSSRNRLLTRAAPDRQIGYTPPK